MFEIIEKYIEKGDKVSKLGNISSICFEMIPDLNWVGFYMFQEEYNALVLGPFSGKKATSIIEVDKGVCGACFRLETIQNIPDVHQVCDHIACDLASNSELVLPIYKNNQIIGVMDIDSPVLNRFDEKTEQVFKKVVEIVEKIV